MESRPATWGDCFFRRVESFTYNGLPISGRPFVEMYVREHDDRYCCILAHNDCQLPTTEVVGLPANGHDGRFGYMAG